MELDLNGGHLAIFLGGLLFFILYRIDLSRLWLPNCYSSC